MKRLTKPLLALVLVCSFFTAKAIGNEKPGIITGTIIEKSSNQPVPYASIAVVQKETGQIVTGIISDENGNFKLNDLPFNQYELQISYLGYKKRNIEIQVDKNHNPLKIGEIALETDAQHLEEVTVTEERLKGKQEVDRTVYTVNEVVKRMSKDGTDVLKHIPGVTVDFQDNVTLEGTGNILYLVNGVPRDQQFVAQLNPEDFNKVEVITNPGVEYDADVEAVINIVLKKAPTGGRGSISLTGADPQKIASNHRGSIDYGNEKFRVFISDRLNYQAYTAYSYKETEIANNGDITYFKLSGSGDFQAARNNTNYGIDLFLNDKNTLNLYGNTNAYLSKQSDFNEVGTQTLNGLMTDQYGMITNLDDAGIGFYNSLFFEHKLDEKGHDLSTQFDYYNFSSEADNTFDLTYTYLDSLLDTPIEINRFENTRNHRQMIQSRNEYSRMISNMRWKFGYWAYYQWLDNEFLGLTEDSRFKFNELRHEAFANGSGSLGKLKYSIGLRYAYSKSRINATATNTYNALLPQLSLMYKIKKGRSLNFSARRRIVRPNMNHLNPFEVRMDSASIQTGNSELDPQIINRMELQYGINFNKNYLGPKVFFEYTENGIQNMININDEGKTVIRPENIGKRYEYGLSLSGSVKLVRWVKINANARVYNTNVSGPDNYSEDLWVAGANGNMVFTPWKDRKINFSTVVQYSSARLGYKSKHTRDILFLLAVDMAIKDNLKIAGAFNPMSQKFKYAGTEQIDTDYYYLQEGRVDVSQLFMVTVSYNFNWGKSPKKIERSTEYEGDGGGGIL